MPPQRPVIDLNDTSNRIIAGIILALIFLGGWWFIAQKAAKMYAAPDADSAEAEDEMLAGGPNEPRPKEPTQVLGPTVDDAPQIAASTESIDVVDQPAGPTVQVREATLVQMGWIAVRDSSGRTLGAGRFDEGSHSMIEVPLLRATSPGERYQVLIYVDDGNRQFDLHDDILVMSADGSVAGDLFVAQ